MTTRVVMFSGGAGSWATGRLLADRFGTDGLLLLFADTQIEDEDTYRFLREAADDIGGELIQVEDGRDPWQVFFDVRYLGNTRIDPCSRILKRQLLRDWLEENCDPDDTQVFLGIDWTEIHRLKKAIPYWTPWKVKSPLSARWGRTRFPHKRAMLEELEERGIERQRLYELGFPHANCFAGETRFITPSGLRALEEACGEMVKVLGEGGVWRDAEIRAFGEQDTFSVTLSRAGETHMVWATTDHRWFIEGSNGQGMSYTAALEAGDVVSYLVPAGQAPPDEHWRVQEVKYRGVEPVYCAVVPEGRMFALEHNLKVHNCGGFCIKAGHAHFKLLLETMPARYRRHEEREQSLRAYLGKDIAILRDRRGGVTRPLTLRALRERIEAERADERESSVDKHDWGGCACFSPNDYDEEELSST